MNALLSNLPRKRTIVGIFLFWIFAIGTFQVKQYANEKNYGHCIMRDAFPSRYDRFLSRNSSDQIDPIDKKQIKAISRRYNIPKKRVESRLETHRKLRISFRSNSYSRAMDYSKLSRVDFSKLVEALRVTPKQKKLTMKQKVSRYVESTKEFFVGGYFKIMGISFSRKSCKERVR